MTDNTNPAALDTAPVDTGSTLTAEYIPAPTQSAQAQPAAPQTDLSGTPAPAPQQPLQGTAAQPDASATAPKMTRPSLLRTMLAGMLVGSAAGMAQRTAGQGAAAGAQAGLDWSNRQNALQQQQMQNQQQQQEHDLRMKVMAANLKTADVDYMQKRLQVGNLQMDNVKKLAQVGSLEEDSNSDGYVSYGKDMDYQTAQKRYLELHNQNPNVVVKVAPTGVSVDKDGDAINTYSIYTPGNGTHTVTKDDLTTLKNTLPAGVPLPPSLKEGSKVPSATWSVIGTQIRSQYLDGLGISKTQSDATKAAADATTATTKAKYSDQEEQLGIKEKQTNISEKNSVIAKNNAETAKANQEMEMNRTAMGQSDAFGNHVGLVGDNAKTIASKEKVFSHDLVQPLLKTEGTFQQFQGVMNDIRAGKNLTGAQSVVALFNAIGISATPMKGMGFKISNNVIEEHAEARGLGESLYQKLLKLKSGDVVTPQQIADYAKIAVGARHDAYLNAANEATRQGLGVDFLPRGNNRPIDPDTAKIFFDVAGGDPTKARAAAQKFGWKF